MSQSSSTSVDQEINSHSDSRQIIEQKDIPDTPFKAVKFVDHWYLTLGKYRLTEGLTYDEVIQEAFDTSWTRIMQIIQILIDENEALKSAKYKEIEQQLQKTP